MRIQSSALLALGTLFCLVAPLSAQTENKPKPQDTEVWEPVPKVVTPGATCGAAPSDAIVLFDGKNLDEWVSAQDHTPAKWLVADSILTVNKEKGVGNIETKRKFKNYQLHVEWRIPENITGSDQARGNSGVFLMGLYEVQVLDSYENKTYADGQAAALYGQYPPLVNASLPPGQWQRYDIVFHGPRFDASGKVLRHARVTVFHNGVLVQYEVQLTGPTAHGERPPYKVTPEKLPLGLQDHHTPVRYRNIWVRELKETAD